MQTIVQEGKLPMEQAVKVLKQHHQKGESIDTCIASGTSGSASERTSKQTSAAARPVKLNRLVKKRPRLWSC